MNWAALLSLRAPFFILQVSLSLGASVFIGVYLRKPTSKEGSRVYLTKGSLNGVWVKTWEMVPVRQRPGINKSLSSSGAWPCNYIHHTTGFSSSSSSDSSAAGGMFCSLQESATVRWTSFWFMVTPRQWHDGPSGVSNANIYPAGHWGLHKLICNCVYVFTDVRGEASETETPALTFVYAFPPLSSCRENRKKVMKPGIQRIQLHITEASNYRERWNYRLTRGSIARRSQTFSIKCVKILPTFYESSSLPINVICVICNQVKLWELFCMTGCEFKPLIPSQWAEVWWRSGQNTTTH